MKLLVVRHAIAQDRVEFARSGQDDAQRPLTKIGRVKMRKAARGLARLVPAIDVLAASPFRRALRTAEIIAQAHAGLDVTPLHELAPPSDAEALVRWLRTQHDRTTVALVGHEPDMGRLVGFLVSGTPRSFLEMKKGAACMLELPAPIHAGTAQLLWALTSGQLRRLRA